MGRYQVTGVDESENKLVVEEEGEKEGGMGAGWRRKEKRGLEGKEEQKKERVESWLVWRV